MWPKGARGDRERGPRAHEPREKVLRRPRAREEIGPEALAHREIGPPALAHMSPERKPFLAQERAQVPRRL